MRTCLFEVSPSIYNLEESVLRSVLPGCRTDFTISDIKYYTLVTRFKITFEQEYALEEYSYALHAYRFCFSENVNTVYTIRNAFKFIPKGVQQKQVVFINGRIYEHTIATQSIQWGLDRNAAPFVLSYLEEEKVRFSPIPPEENECLGKLADILFEQSDKMKEGDYLKLMNYLQKKRNCTI